MARDHIRDYTVVAGDNTDIDGIDIAEGTAPSNINNAIREAMADTAEWFDDLTGKLVSGGLVNAYTLTTNDGLAAYAAGTRYTFEANLSNTAAVTLNINAIGAKAIVKNNDVALSGGEIEAGQMVDVVYEATADNFQMVSQPAKVILESLDIDNININGNTISSTDTNGNIILTPNGTGDVTPGTTGTHTLGSPTLLWGAFYSTGIVTQNPSPLIRFTDTTSSSTSDIQNETGDLYLRADTGNADLNTAIVHEIDGTAQAKITDGSIEPISDNDIDLGTSTNLFKIGYFHDLRIRDSSPSIIFTDTDDTGTPSGEIQLFGNTGSIVINTDTGNAVADSVIQFKIDNVAQCEVTDGTFEPQTDNDIDLGTALLEFKDLYIDGTANIDALTLTSGATCTTILDEDNMVSNSATALATQQSIKAYVDTRVAQVVEATPYTTYSSHTTVMPTDNTIPQNTEGEEIITAAITPQGTTNRLVIECEGFFGGSTILNVAMALFQDTTAGALAATVETCSAVSHHVNMKLRHEMAAGTTSPTTFKIRVGPSSGTVYANGNSVERKFGGIAAVRLRITEYGPDFT